MVVVVVGGEERGRGLVVLERVTALATMVTVTVAAPHHQGVAEAGAEDATPVAGVALGVERLVEKQERSR